MSGDSESVIVFDMGGVLYDFQGASLIARSSRRPRRWRSEEVRAHWPTLSRGFETGSSSEADFAEAVVQRYDLTLAPSEFLSEFREAAVGFYEGALSLVAELRERYRVLSLSNTNPAQWPKVLADLGPEDPFHAHHPSHLSGFHKPDPRAFAAISGAIRPAPRATSSTTEAKTSTQPICSVGGRSACAAWPKRALPAAALAYSKGP